MLPIDIYGVFIIKNVMGKKINLDEKLIIKKYLQGRNSIQIAEEFNVSKPTILKILNDNKVVRKRNRCKSIEIKLINGKYVTERKCPRCEKIILITTKTQVTTCRNYFNSENKNSVCKSCLSENMKGNNNPFYNKKHSEETKKQISENRKGKATGNKNSMSNKMWKEKARKNLKQKWDSGELDHVKKIMSEKMNETRRLGKLKSINRSKTEKEIINEIKKLGYSVKHSHRVDTKICDIFLPKLNLIIEYNGDYWHCNPNKYNKDYFHQVKGMTAEKLWEYDRNKVDIILNNGYNLEVVWESDYISDRTIINKLIKKYDTK